jgi:hypothetical protein
MDTFAEYPKDGNVSALVAARITANLQTARTTSSSRKGKAKGPAKGKGKGKARVEPKSQMSSETDDSQESSANEIIQACDIDDGELLKAVHASKLPVKVGASSRVSNDPWVPAAVASLDTISYPMPQGQCHISDPFELQDE